MDFTGKVTNLETRTGSNWSVQDVRIEELEGKYPESVYAFIFGEDSISKANLKEGDVVTASISLNTREYNGKIYNSLKIWKVEHISKPAPQPQQAQPEPQKPARLDYGLPF